MIKKTYSKPKEIPGIGGNGKGISLYGKSPYDIGKGNIKDLKVRGLKGDPWKNGSGALKKLVGQ